ncbi:MAG: tryptophan--tRNA ligase [Candidatus Liptonbacteria bacterium CG11_big_fil_rev_8_21_14_0_20_35_14]|uniref:Tryptophan--tRNA ligase n=1 Tax=Candidatus Liptonbacteria bacterium CG11_big_fil_rev_8_21_14_0_20_35_14 TaxID=1974634 RepID=A0A2H0N7I2_9BACT|nr:MAG: tryptophan--tRNA ligase [Candidatus Liptonbacteria bacterium CG11_big_fil_rev_8_21_14_0_20_35_14]
MVADVQALTDNFKTPEKVSENVRGVVLDYLSVGLDPRLVTIFIQSQIPEIAELTIFYLNIVNVGKLEQNPTVKTELKQKNFGKEIPVGFLVYPVSQAADITSFEAELVPVGEDQLPMIELTRDIVKKFNTLYGKNTLTLPEAVLSNNQRLIGIDGKEKMSKSLNNAIYLSDTKDEVNKKVSKMYTDPNRIKTTDPGKVEGNPLFIYLDAFARDQQEVKDLKKRYRLGKVGDVEVKSFLAQNLNDFLNPIRMRRQEFAGDTKKINKIIRDGSDHARQIASSTLLKVKKAMKINYTF